MILTPKHWIACESYMESKRQPVASCTELFVGSAFPEISYWCPSPMQSPPQIFLMLSLERVITSNKKGPFLSYDRHRFLSVAHASVSACGRNTEFRMFF